MGQVSTQISVTCAHQKMSVTSTETRIFAGDDIAPQYLKIDAEQEIDLSEWAGSGQIFIRNCHASNPILVGFVTNVFPIEIKANGATVMPLAADTTSIFIKSGASDTDAGEFTKQSYSTNTLEFAAAHGLVLDDIVQVETTGTLPSGLSLATDYYVVAVTATVVALSLSRGGTRVELADAGTGTHSMTKLGSTYGTILAQSE